MAIFKCSPSDIQNSVTADKQGVQTESKFGID
jgi:hypothetical protein